MSLTAFKLILSLLSTFTNYITPAFAIFEFLKQVRGRLTRSNQNTIELHSTSIGANDSSLHGNMNESTMAQASKQQNDNEEENETEKEDVGNVRFQILKKIENVVKLCH